MSLVFYDTETTGLKAPFDQILQFAAIRTDSDLNEIDRFEIRCRLLPHIIPSPGAMHVTGITVAQLTDPSIPSHYEMVRAIRAKLLSWSPCNFLGYNSIGFDEHFFRQALYQTLHGPYLTNSDGNTRSDVMRIVQASTLFAPGAVRIPTDAQGHSVFKLDEVAPTNGFAHKNAHDAMADVEATIFLSRLLMAKAPNLWSASMRFSKKAAVTDYVENEQMVSLSDFYFGKGYSWLVTFLGVNPANSSEVYVYNLEVDPASLKNLKSGALAARLVERPKPIRTMRSNAAPMLMAAEEAPDSASGKKFGVEELERRAEMLRSDPDFRNRLVAAFQGTKEETEPSPYVEEQIYDGFSSAEDAEVLEEFHRVEWNERSDILEKLKDGRLKQLGRKLIHAERPEALDDATRRECDHTRAQRHLETTAAVPWLTLPKAISEVDSLLLSADKRSFTRLKEHRAYLVLCLGRAKASTSSKDVAKTPGSRRNAG